MFLTTCKSQSVSDQIRICKNFVESLMDEKQSNTNIIETYIILDKTSQSNIEFVNSQIESLRNTFKSKSIDRTKLSYVQLNDAQEFDLMISEEQMGYVIIVKYEGKVLFPLLFKSGMINSFTTMNKGGKRIFINY
jgi:hypothetical protein